jgi:hypothetical protein
MNQLAYRRRYAMETPKLRSAVARSRRRRAGMPKSATTSKGE